LSGHQEDPQGISQALKIGLTIVGDDVAGDQPQTGQGTPAAGSSTPTDPSILERIGSAAEVVVFAPLGFALEARSLMPRLAERGRNHIAMAKMMGEFAVRKGADDLKAGLGRDPLSVVLRSVGLADRRGDGPGPSPDNSRREGGSAASGAASGSPVPRVSPAAQAAAAGIDAGSLGIPGYDLLSASQVVPRLDGLSVKELDLVQRYEAGTRGRKTILAKIAQLRADDPPAS
jgi:hypothetical protein